MSFEAFTSEASVKLDMLIVLFEVGKTEWLPAHQYKGGIVYSPSVAMESGI
jgi:hypothetical protein